MSGFMGNNTVIQIGMLTDNIEKALQMAEEKGIRGKAITPFLLDTIQRITGGASLEANIQLVRNNAVVASRIARELALAKAD